MNLARYWRIYLNDYNILYQIFWYRKSITTPLDYDTYWEQRDQDKERHQFNPDNMGLERYFSLRYSIAACLAKNIEQGSKVADLGCGDGALLKFIVNQKKVQAKGYDISPKAIEIVKRMGLEGEVADITNQAFIKELEPVDYFILTDILEHIPRPEEVLSNLKDKAQKGILLSIPNTGYYIHRLRLLFGCFPQQWIHFSGEHLRFWTIRDFRWWVKPLGYRIIKSLPTWGTIGLKNIFPGLFSKNLVFLIKHNS